MCPWISQCISLNYSVTNISNYSRRKNNRQKIETALSIITTGDFILRGSYFCEKCIKYDNFVQNSGIVLQWNKGDCVLQLQMPDVTS